MVRDATLVNGSLAQQAIPWRPDVREDCSASSLPVVENQRQVSKWTRICRPATPVVTSSRSDRGRCARLGHDRESWVEGRYGRSGTSGWCSPPTRSSGSAARSPRSAMGSDAVESAPPKHIWAAQAGDVDGPVRTNRRISIVVVPIGRSRVIVRLCRLLMTQLCSLLP
jgi:hypothetical protein